MNAKFDLRALGEGVVYVKPIRVADLPEELQSEAGDRETIFSVHNQKGEQIALVADRSVAFDLARQHDLTPMAVH